MVAESDQLDHRAVLALAKHLGWPLILDPLSNCRKDEQSPYILQNFESLLDDLQVDVVLKFGDRFICKSLEPWICKIHQVVFVSPHNERSDPESAVTHRILMHPNQFIHDIIQYTPARIAGTFLRHCFELSQIAQKSIDIALFKEPLISEIAFVRLLSKIQYPFNLFVGNSMPIRHVDRVFYPHQFRGEIFANRGHSGIDGNVATAIGVAIKNDRPTIALIGDMTFWHDLNSLFILQKNPLPIIFFVFNNNGGQIFSYMKEYVNLEEKQELFVMPHNLDYKSVCDLFGLDYVLFDQDFSIERVLELNRPVLVELKTDVESDRFHTQQLKTVFVEVMKQNAPVVYK